MVRLAVTGGIACGKSLVAGFLEERGVAVCDADAIAHRVMAPGEPAYEEIVLAFGRDVLSADGTIDRRRMGQRVFSNDAERERLNEIVHPRVKEAWKAWISENERMGRRMAAVVAALLFEAGEGLGWNAVICVTASTALQTARLMARGFTEEEARCRIRAQWPQERKMERADYVIVNNGGLDLLREQTDRVLRAILEKRAGEEGAG